MVRKSKHAKQSASGIRQVSPNDAPLRFSFRLFDSSDGEVCPTTFNDGYVQTLMCRLKDISSWTVQEFLTPAGRAIRNHPIAWEETARPKGFSHLPDQYEDYPAFQFSVSANEYGRVHGLMINDTFHVVWLDCNHRLYA